MFGKFCNPEGRLALPVLTGLAALNVPPAILVFIALIWKACTTLRRSRAASTTAIIKFVFFMRSP